MLDPRPNRQLTRRAFLQSAAVAAAFGASLPSLSACAPAAPAYPTKPINMIIPLAAGSAPDATFRILAQEAEKDLGQKIVIINRTGPGGTTGVAETIAAKNDGYTIGMCAVAMVTIQAVMQDVPYRGPDEITTIVQADEAPTCIYVKADSPIKNLAGFIDEAKKRPGQLTNAVSGGPYNILHLELVLLEQLTGARFNLIPYDSAQHIPAVLGGTVESGIGQVALLAQQVKSGGMRALCVFGTKRATAMPDVPSAKELGFDIVDIPYEFVFGPKGLAKDVVDRLVTVFTKAVKSQAFTDYGDKTGLVVSYAPAEELTKKLASDDKRYREVIDKVGWPKRKT